MAEKCEIAQGTVYINDRPPIHPHHLGNNEGQQKLWYVHQPSFKIYNITMEDRLTEYDTPAGSKNPFIPQNGVPLVNFTFRLIKCFRKPWPAQSPLNLPASRTFATL